MIGFIGGGNMAEALIKGLLSKGLKDIIFFDPSVDRIKYLMENYGVGFGGSNIEVIKRCSIIIIAVKPQIIDTLINEIHSAVDETKLFISIAAGIRLSYLSNRLQTKRLIRVMPNTPALVQEGMSVLSSMSDVREEDLLKAKEIFETVGKVLILPEEKMDAVTALSGSGPGFLSYLVETIIEAGVKIGLSEEESDTMAIQTFIGTAKVLETGIKPAKLREMVTSPKGTTFAGLEKMRELDINRIIYEVILSAKNRSQELGRE